MTFRRKICEKCRVSKTLRAFPIRKGVRDGKVRSSFCRACSRSKARPADNPDR